VFHISDLHMRSAATGGPQKDRARLEADSRWRVLGEKWMDNLAALRKDGVSFDLVAFTGDLGDRGHATDYPRAITFLKETCAALGVPLTRLFVIPGNHDINQNTQREAWESLRSDISADPGAYSQWMAGVDGKLRGDGRRDQILERERAFWDAVTIDLGRPELGPRRSPHQHLGYVQEMTLPGLSQPIHVIGLDTAWLAGDKHDSGKLWLTEHQVSLLTTTADGSPLPGFRLALMHHRLADLADGADARKQLADRVDLLLHGHQHELTVDVLQGPDKQLLVLAAGCLYEGDERHRYLNTCQVIDLELDENARPRRAEVRFRGWSQRNFFWGDDALLYENAPGGRLRLRNGTAGWYFDEGSLLLERHEVFIGREGELARIGAALERGGLGRVAIVALQGMAGVGKTYLAQEFYARHPSRFGGYQHVVLDPEHPGTVATWITMLGERAGIDVARATEATVAAELAAQRALVHVDNVDSRPAAELVVALARALAGVPMLVTGRYSELGTARGSGWTRIELAPLDRDPALDLLRAELEGAEVRVPEAELCELVRQVSGLPLALHLAAGYLRRGMTVERFLARLSEKGFALGTLDPADHVVGDRARGVLATSFAISRELMLETAGAQADTWKAALLALGWAPQTGFGRSLGAAITGLEEASGAFDDFIDATVALSLARRLRPKERVTAAWAVHPLLGEFLRVGTERAEIDARIGEWVVARADHSPSHRAARWEVLSMEAVSIGEWLGVATDAVIGRILPRSWDFAVSRGPVAPWFVAAQRASRRTATGQVLWALCQLASRAGEPETARDAATELAHLAREAHDDRAQAIALGKIAEVLVSQGELDEALRILREEVLPVLERFGDQRLCAITLGQIADVHYYRGELDEALRIRREEELPVYERLNDRRSRAITLAQIADILAQRGELDEALRFLREEALPIYDQFGDARERAITLGQIADVLVDRGDLDEALRIRRQEQLPTFEHLGDVRERALTVGKIADVLAIRGDLDEALRIWREEQLPVYERLGNVRSRAHTQAKIAEVLADRGEFDEALQILRYDVLPAFEKLGDREGCAITLGKIADVHYYRAELDEALRIRREEVLPIFERLGDMRSRAITLTKIADVLHARGKKDEALRIWREEALPAFERLGEVRARAITLGKIANVLVNRGELDEALRIHREDILPVVERLGDVKGRAVTLGEIAQLLAARGELDEALRIQREEALPVFERLGEVRECALTLGQIADVLLAQGKLDEALRIRYEETLPAFERLGDVRERAITLGKIADVLTAQGEFDRAMTLWNEALAVFEQLRVPDLIDVARRKLERLRGR
jgi:tetratricopeptide (TPR) repeat protein